MGEAEVTVKDFGARGATSESNFALVRATLQDYADFRIVTDVIALPNLSSKQREWVHKFARRSRLISKSTGSKDKRTLLVSMDLNPKGKAYVRNREMEPPDPNSEIKTYIPKDGKGGFEEIPSCSNPLEDLQGFFLEGSQANAIEHFRRKHAITKQDEVLLTSLNTRPKVVVNNLERLPRYMPVVPPRPAKAPNSRLPAAAVRTQLLQTVRTHQVTLVTGETGCGKTTQVPQYLLEEAREAGKAVSVVVTQPRRLPATAVAKRVAQERGEKLGATVGYHIRFDRCYGQQTGLMFCTSGVLLKTLMDGNEPLENLTHIILDEVHEREQFTDFLLTHLKLCLSKFPSLKLILMSATMSEHVDLFKAYFAEFKVAVCHIPCRTFDVNEVYLEDILLNTNYDAALVAQATEAALEEAARLSDMPAAREPDELWALDNPSIIRPGGLPRRVQAPSFGPSECGLGRVAGVEAMGSGGTASRDRFVERRVDGRKELVSEGMGRAFDAVKLSAIHDDGSPDCIEEADSPCSSPGPLPPPPVEQQTPMPRPPPVADLQPFELTPPGSSTDLTFSAPSWNGPPVYQAPPFPPTVTPVVPDHIPHSASQSDIYSSMGTWGDDSYAQSSGWGNGYGHGYHKQRSWTQPEMVTPSEARRLCAAAVPAARLEELKTQQLLDLYWEKRRQSERVDVHLLVHLLRFLIPKAVGYGSILVFLPGMEDMSSVRDRLERECGSGAERLLILTLHSQIHDDSVSAQLFNPAPPNTVKVILSTNIAEASITIEDVVMVVDSGKAKEKNYHAATESTSLVEKWVSKSSATQRKGRAGRCRDGVVYRLYSRQQFAHMKETGVPEILRVPIFEACLKARQMIPPEMRIADFLGSAPEPPANAALTDAVNFLKTLEALDEKESMTELGRFLAEVSLGPKLAISLLNAIVLRCLDPALSILAAISSRDPFMVPFGEDRDRFKRERAETSRGFYSDHYALFRVVFIYAKEGTKGFGAKKRFCVENGLNFQAMEMIINAKRQIARDLGRLGLIQENRRGMSWRNLNENSHSWPTVKAAVAAGAYPFLALIDHSFEPRRIRTRFEEKAKILPQSTLAEQLPPPASKQIYLAYEELRTLTGLSSLAVALFAGPARVGDSRRSTADVTKAPQSFGATPVHYQRQTWDLGQIRVSAPLKDAELAWFLRRKWKVALLRKLANWTAAPTPEEDELVQVLATVLRAEDAAADLDPPPEFSEYAKNPTIGFVRTEGRPSQRPDWSGGGGGENWRDEGGGRFFETQRMEFTRSDKSNGQLRNGGPGPSAQKWSLRGEESANYGRPPPAQIFGQARPGHERRGFGGYERHTSAQTRPSEESSWR